MAGPNHGALGASFKIARVLQAACLIAIIGMTANFISEMVSRSTTPPKVLVGTITVVRAAFGAMPALDSIAVMLTEAAFHSRPALLCCTVSSPLSSSLMAFSRS
jgi:hypothetical protein